MFARLLVTVLVVAACLSGWAQDTSRKIQVLDKVKVTCTEESLLSRTYQVSKDGVILMDFLGAVELVGLTDKEASDLISKKLVDDRILRKATVLVQSIVDGQVQSSPPADKPEPVTDTPKPKQGEPQGTQDSPKAVSPVKFTGAVSKPGELSFQEGLKLSDVVRVAGTTETTDLGSVTVKSPDGTEKKVDATQPANDLTLKPGDEVVFATKVVPVVSEVYVFGGVAKPGAVKLSGSPTVKDAINAAGGFSAGAVKKKVRIERDGQAVQMLDFTISDTDAPLKANDRVVVEVSEKRAYVQIDGAVRNPGFFVVTPGMKLGSALDAAGGYLPKARLDKVKVTPASGGKPYTVNFREIEQGYSGDIILQEGDQVTVPGEKKNSVGPLKIAAGVSLFWLLFHR